MNKKLFQEDGRKLTAIGRFNDRSGNREIHDRQFGRPPSVDFTIRFDTDCSVEDMRPLMPEEILREVHKLIMDLPERFYFTPVEFFTEKYRVKVHSILERNY